MCKEKRVAFFLDYDGTLTPIVNDPAKAIISDSAREVVRKLSLRYPTAIVTGRTHAKARSFMQLDDLYYAGSHGFDIVGPGHVAKYSVADSARPALQEISRVIEDQIEGIRGAMIEDNTFSISVHYRNVNAEEHGKVEDIVIKALEDFPMLGRREGKMVHELRPEVDWHKGKAVEWLLDLIQKDYEGQVALAFYYCDSVGGHRSRLFTLFFVSGNYSFLHWGRHHRRGRLPVPPQPQWHWDHRPRHCMSQG